MEAQEAIDAIQEACVAEVAFIRSQDRSRTGPSQAAVRESEKTRARLFTMVVGRKPTEEEFRRLNADYGSHRLKPSEVAAMREP